MWGKLPSYIPSENFALALMDLLAPAKDSATDKKTAFLGLRNSVAGIQNDKIRDALLPLIDVTGGDIDAARVNIEKWYDNAMDRVAGLYKRRVQYFTFALGLLAAGFLNADTLTIVNSLSNDPKLRDALVANAQEYARVSAESTRPAASPTPSAEDKALQEAEDKKEAADKASAVEAKIAECKNDKNKDLVQCKALIEACADPITDQCRKSIMACDIVNSPQCKSEECRKDVNSSDCKLSANLDQVRSLGLPLGWNSDDPRTAPPPGPSLDSNLPFSTNFYSILAWLWSWIILIFWKLPGWLITAVAISLGAPFWFDLLNKFMVVRSTVKPAEKSPRDKSKD